MSPELFGPRSVTWQLHADPAMWVAGVSALFLQALHPLAVRGVVRLSDFRDDPLGRLRRTASFVSITTYGTAAQAEEAGARVRRIHAALKVPLPDGGKHPVDDPDLLRWVHCAEVASYVDVVRRAGFPLTDRHVDLYLTEQRRAAALVGLDPETVPGTWADMGDYFERMRPALARTVEADEIYDFLTTPPVNPPMRAGWWPVARVAYGLLPPWAVELYGRPAWSPAQAEWRLRALRRTAKLIPDRLRWRVPTGNILRAIDRLGRDATPSPGNLP
ncbi:oxygenase MpaB family protein [Longispora sp. K20-0274]|uniref:oxygenase MpaB family protein n=1 Tax=Longispora sp. K20-0274 TaxID=3088255 RepID=UPI003999C3D6